MLGQEVRFFAFWEDINNILNVLEENYPLKYCQTGLFDSNIVPIYSSVLDIPDLGFSTGDWIMDPGFLVMPNDVKLIVNEIPQRKGGVKYSVDQAENKKCIRMKLGGVFKHESNVLVAGRIDTVSSEEIALVLFKEYSKRIKKEFKRVNDFYDGKKALEALYSGWRLVLDSSRSTEFDLKP